MGVRAACGRACVGSWACVRILCATLWSGVVLQADLGASGSIERQEIADDVAGKVLRYFMDEGRFKGNWRYTESLTRNASVSLVNQLSHFYGPCDDHGVDVCCPPSVSLRPASDHAPFAALTAVLLRCPGSFARICDG